MTDDIENVCSLDDCIHELSATIVDLQARGYSIITVVQALMTASVMGLNELRKQGASDEVIDEAIQCMQDAAAYTGETE